MGSGSLEAVTGVTGGVWYDSIVVGAAINLQRDKGQAKPYQVRQVRSCDSEVRAEGERVMYKYEIILYWSRIDGVFVAEVPELPGCMAHGDTQEAALGNVNQAMELWIDTARESGDPIPEPKGERLMLA